MARLASLAKCCRLSVCVDDEENVRQLQEAAGVQDAVIHCLVEYEVGMNRCGVDTPQAVLALARQIMSCPNLRFDGIQAYAGNLAHEEDQTKRREQSDVVEKRLR